MTDRCVVRTESRMNHEIHEGQSMEHHVCKLPLAFSQINVESLASLAKLIETVFVNLIQGSRLFMCCGLGASASDELTQMVK